MNKERFVTDMNILGATFNREISTPMLEGYWLVLKALTDFEWGKAVAYSLECCRFMPSPAEMAEAGRPKVVVNPESAIKEIRLGFLRYGRSRTPEWSSPLVAQAIETCGGWSHLCNIEQEQFDRYVVPQIVKAITRSASDGAIAIGYKPGMMQIGGAVQ